ncbi:MAG: tryptophan synthase subunit alpha [Acidobacteriota bacterium]
MSAGARVEDAIRAANASGRPALVAYLTAGFPAPARFADDVRTLARAADVVEIGVPFSDPMADGVTIQRASRAALEQGTTPTSILDALEAMDPRPAAPLVLMSYLNPLLALGVGTLAQRAVRAGIDAVIVPDLPLDEAAPLAEPLARCGVGLVQLATPVTPPERLARLCAASRGFVYAVTVTGTTGGRAAIAPGTLAYLERVRAAAQVPVCAGFGIRSAQQMQALAGHVDGVIVGSAIVECLERGEDPAALLEELRAATEDRR